LADGAAPSKSKPDGALEFVMQYFRSAPWPRIFGVNLKRVFLTSSVCFTAVMLLLGVPMISELLVDRLQIFPGLPPSELVRETAGRPMAIVILAAGRRVDASEYGEATIDELSLERLRYGAFIARKTGLPVLVSGGFGDGKASSLAKLLATALFQDYGVQARWLEDQSTNTAENAIYSSRMLKRDGINRIVLVTHAWHLRRAHAAFTANDMSVISAPTAFYHPAQEGFWRLIPSVAAFRMSTYAIHESLGILWYGFRYGI
jgi:uncharacterized SAM-binding protein YcdF (DUF218 family)